MKHVLTLLVLIVTLSATLPAFAYTNICSRLVSNWKGNWENENHFNQSASVQIAFIHDNYFRGIFYLDNGNKGAVSGFCQELNQQEALLYLKKDAPYYNPCRGRILSDHQQYFLHFYCFNPNQSGYFTLSSI